jgi:hypothetical protein
VAADRTGSRRKQSAGAAHDRRTALPGQADPAQRRNRNLKTWLALILAKAEIDAGYPVAWADLDAMGEGEILARLRTLGVSDAQISRQFIFYAPDGSLTGAALCGLGFKTGFRPRWTHSWTHST